MRYDCYPDGMTDELDFECEVPEIKRHKTYGAEKIMPDHEVKEQVLVDLERLQELGVVEASLAVAALDPSRREASLATLLSQIDVPTIWAALAKAKIAMPWRSQDLEEVSTDVDGNVIARMRRGIAAFGERPDLWYWRVGAQVKHLQVYEDNAGDINVAGAEAWKALALEGWRVPEEGK